MSVSSECRLGDEIYVIDGFVSKVVFTNEELMDTENSLELDIGDKVIYLDWFNKNIGDNLYKFIRYRDKNGNDLEAVETFFVTKEVWNRLEEYFFNKR